MPTAANCSCSAFPMPVALALVVAASVYLRGWYRLRSASPGAIPAWRVAAFVSGLCSIWIAVGSPLARLDHELLTIHMVKHLLLMAVGAPLVLLGAPAQPLICGLPQRFLGSTPCSAVGVPGFQWLAQFLSNTKFCWFAATAAVIGWHLPAAFELAQRSHGWHEIEHASFLFAGLIFWSPVIQPRLHIARASSRWSVPLYLFLATLPCDALSAFLAFCDRVVYPSYLSAPRLLNLSPLEDQELAGALMWVFVTFIYLVPAVVVTVQILSPAGTSSFEQTQSRFPKVVAQPPNVSEVEAM